MTLTVQGATERLGLSARAFDRIRKIARTLADLESAADIQAKHVAESIPGAELELIDNIGHCPQLEAPEIFHPKLIRFLKSPPR